MSKNKKKFLKKNDMCKKKVGIGEQRRAPSIQRDVQINRSSE
jgi:hypothetical protein